MVCLHFSKCDNVDLKAEGHLVRQKINDSFQNYFEDSEASIEQPVALFERFFQHAGNPVQRQC